MSNIRLKYGYPPSAAQECVPHLHYDFFYHLPDTKKDRAVKCRVCGTICDVERKGYQACSGGGYNPSGGPKYDVFSCPRLSEDWHQNAVPLFMEILATHSPSLAKILESDLDKIVAANKKRKKR